MINKFITASALTLFVCAAAQATHQETWETPVHHAASSHQEESASSYDARQFALAPTTALSYARSFDLGAGSGGGDPKPFKIVYPPMSVLSLERDMRQARLFSKFDQLSKRNWNPQQESLAQRALTVLLEPVVVAEGERETLPHVLADNFVEKLNHGSQCATILLYLPSQDLTPSFENDLAKALESRIEWLDFLESASNLRLFNLFQLTASFDVSHALTSLTPLVPLTPLTEAGFELLPPTLTPLATDLLPPLATDLSNLYIKEEEAEAQGAA